MSPVSKNSTELAFSEAMTFIRRRIRFDLLRTTVIALRGERGLKSSSAVKIADLDINLEPVH